MKRSALKRKSTLKRGSGFAASKEQREKVEMAGHCLQCGVGAYEARVDPAHVIDRSLGGCDDALCVIPLCRGCHRSYDEGTGDSRLDVLPLLTREEQAHAVLHLGITRAYRRLTGETT